MLLAGTMLMGLAACGEAAEAQPTATTAQPTETTAPVQALTEEEQQILQERRAAVVQKMRDSVTFLWRCDVDITFSKQRQSEGVENDEAKNVMTLKAGRLYSGLPYTHGGSSLYDWQLFATEVDEKGIYHVSGITTAHLTGYDTWEPNRIARLGSDCADTVSWAWGTVSSTMSCTQTYEMTASHGAIKVGQFECDPERHSNTIQVCAKNGMAVMYAAYAQLQPGDAVVHNNTDSDGGSHAMLVSEVVVPTKENGDPDYLNAYILTVHQTSGNLFGEKSYFDEELGEEVYYCGGVDDKYMFYKLYDKGYLPFTVKELIDPAPLEEERVSDSLAEPSFEKLFTGKLTANYPISYVTVTVADEVGQTVQQGSCFATESELKCFDMVHFTGADREVMHGRLELDTLAAGSYRCTVTCRLSTGRELTVRDFTFVK